jgi:putative colanic acid biosynthesis acetyltransferase WcaF
VDARGAQLNTTTMEPAASRAPSVRDVRHLDVAANRAARKYSYREQALRVLWSFGRWLIILSPHPCHGWRRMVLRLFGARVGRQGRIHSSTVVYMPWNFELGEWAAVGPGVFIYSLGRVRIGARATVSYRTHICAGSHDFSDPTLPLIKPAVTIADDAWVGTDTFIGPGVTVGEGAIVAARAVVVKDVEPMTVVGGHPAQPIGVHPGLKKTSRLRR